MSINEGSWHKSWKCHNFEHRFDRLWRQSVDWYVCTGEGHFWKMLSTTLNFEPMTLNKSSGLCEAGNGLDWARFNVPPRKIGPKDQTSIPSGPPTTLDWIEPGSMSHQTHYMSYWGRVFTGQMTQPTVSKHWTNIGPKDQTSIPSGPPHHAGNE